MDQFVSLFTRLVVALETIAEKFGSAPVSSAADTSAGTTSAKAGKGAAGKGAAAKAAPTAEEVNAALSELRKHIDDAGEKGLDYAREVMKEAAGCQKMAEIPEDKRADVIKLAAKRLEEYKANNEGM